MVAEKMKNKIEDANKKWEQDNDEGMLKKFDEYTNASPVKNWKHQPIINIIFTPRGFGVTAKDATIKKFRSWLPYFDQNTISFIKKGGGGVDINPLHKTLGTPTIGFIPDSQRMFDLHHSPNDVFSNVHPRELELGTASIAGIIYLIDKYGL